MAVAFLRGVAASRVSQPQMSRSPAAFPLCFFYAELSLSWSDMKTLLPFSV
jgi:hypothetical protein